MAEVHWRNLSIYKVKSIKCSYCCYTCRACYTGQKSDTKSKSIVRLLSRMHCQIPVHIVQYFSICAWNIPGVPKKAERLIFSTLRAKSVILFFTSLHKASSAEENDTKIIEFGWVILILCPFLETLSFSNFAWFLRRMSVELYRDRPSIWCFWGSPLIHVNKRYSVGGNGHMKAIPYTIYAHPSQKSSEIWKWLCFKKWA